MRSIRRRWRCCTQVRGLQRGEPLTALIEVWIVEVRYTKGIAKGEIQVLAFDDEESAAKCMANVIAHGHKAERWML